MGTVLLNFHGQSAIAPTNSSKSGWSDRSILDHDIRNAKGEDIGQPFAHSRVVPLEPERRVVVSRCIVTWLFLISSLPAGRVALRQFHVDAHCENASASKNRIVWRSIKLLRVFRSFFNFSPFFNLKIVYWRLLSILIHSARCWKIYCIQRFLGHERARPAYVAFSFPFFSFVTLLSHLSTSENREATRRRD